MSLRDTKLRTPFSSTTGTSTEGRDVWAGCEPSTGIRSNLPHIRKLGETVLRFQDDAARITAIRPNDPEEAREWALNTIGALPLADDEAVLVSDTKGQLMQLAAPSMNDAVPLDTIGNYDPVFADLLAKLRVQSAGLEVSHLQYLGKLLALPERGILVELGAGSFYERLAALNTLALEKRGQLICHDPTPAGVRAAQARLPDVPYWALPPVSQFLGAALRGAKSPVVFSSKNVLTSMSHERVLDLLSVCRDVRPHHFVMSLSLQFNSRNTSIPSELQVSNDAPNARLVEKTREVLARRMPHLPFNEAAAASIAINQAYMTFYHALTEIAARDLFNRFRQEQVFQFGRVAIVEMHTDLDGDAARELMLVHPLGKTLAAYEHGAFNTVVVGAFGFSVENQPGVPPKHLRVSQPQIHLIFENEKGHLPSIPGARVEVHALDNVPTFTPRAYRFQNPAIILQLLGVPPQKLAGFVKERAADLRKLQRVGAEAGIEHCFSRAGSGIAWLRSGTNSELKSHLHAGLVGQG